MPSTSVGTVLDDEYNTKKLFTLKTKHALDIGHPLSVQSKLILDHDGKAGGQLVKIDPTSWIRLITSYDRLTFEARLWENKVKVAFDAGYLDKPKHWNLFGHFRSNYHFSNFRAGLGLAWFDNNGYFASKLRVCNKKEAVFEGKALLNFGKWRLLDSTSVTLGSWKFHRNNTVLGYLDKDFDVFVQHDGKSDVLKLGKLLGSLVYRYNANNQFAAQLAYENDKATFQLGGLFNVNKNSVIRAKIDDKLNFSTAGKFKVRKNVSLALSTSLALSQGAKAIDLSKTIPLPLGITVDLS